MIIVDTGFWLALANKKDESHLSAKNLFQSLALANEKFITTWCVATETCYFLPEGGTRIARSKTVSGI